jgi:hypothetical protein
MGTTKDITIDDAVPESERVGVGRPIKYPFDRLTKVGQSFFVPGTTTEHMGCVVRYWNMKYAKEGRKFRSAGRDKSGRPLLDAKGKKGVRVRRIA